MSARPRLSWPILIIGIAATLILVGGFTRVPPTDRHAVLFAIVPMTSVSAGVLGLFLLPLTRKKDNER